MNLRKFLITLIPIFLFNGCVVIHDGYVRHYGDNTVERYYYNDNKPHYKRYPYKNYYKTPNRYDNRYDNNKPYNKYNNPNYYYNKHHNNNNYHNHYYIK